MTVLDTLTLALGIDSKGIDSGLAEAQRKIDQGARSLANSLMSPFKAALGSIIAGFSLAAITRQYLQQADAIGKMADSIGADMEELQAWGEAAKQAGGSAEAFQGTVQSLTRNLQQAASAAKGPVAQALQQLGVNATDATGKARDTFDVLRDLADKMEGMDKQKAMALGQRVGIDRGTIMLLQSGRAAVEDLITEMKDLGLYTKEDQEIAGKANQAIAKLGLVCKAASADIMRHIAPAITWVADHLKDLVKDFRQHKAFYLSAIGAIGAALSVKLLPKLLEISGIAKVINAPFLILSGTLASLALVFEDLWVYMHGGKSAFEDWWKELGTGPELLEKFNKAWENVQKTVDKVLKNIQQFYLDTIVYLVSKIDYFYEIFGGLWDVIEGLFNFDFEQIGRGLGKAFTGAWKLIESVFNDIFKGMEKMSVWDAVEKGAKTAWDAVLKLAKGFFNALPPEAQANLKLVWEEFKNFIHWDEIKDKFKWEDIKTTAVNAWNEINKIAKEVLEYLSGKLEYVSNIVDGIWTAINGLFNFDFKQLGEGLGKAFNSAYGLIKSIFNDIFDWFNEISSNSDSVWDTVVNVAKAAWDSLTEFATAFFNQLDPDLQKIIKAVGVFAAAWAIEKTVKGITDIGNAISATLKLVSANPFMLIVSAIALIIVYWDEISEKIHEFFEWIEGKIDWLIEKWESFKKSLSEIAKGEENREKTEVAAVSNASDWSTMPTELAGIQPPKPTPADGVSSQAAAAGNVTNNETTNNVQQQDSRSFVFNFSGAPNDADGFFKAVKGPLSKNPGWMPQSASTMQFGGAS